MAEKSSFTTRSFYGPKNKRKWQDIERCVDIEVKKFSEQKIPKPFPHRIVGPSTTWKTFFRQQDAFTFCRSTSKDLHVFAFESETYEENTGQRMYLLTSYPVFWHYYSQLKAEQRHHYEVIPEGAVCKLYFDLEYNKSLNPDCDGNIMVDVFIKYVCMALEAQFRVRCTRGDVLDLDASTDSKFSRHLIFQTKKAMFKDNIHAGLFVSYILSQVIARLQQIENTDSSAVRHCSSMDSSLCDKTSDCSVNKSNSLEVLHDVKVKPAVIEGSFQEKISQNVDKKYEEVLKHFSDEELQLFFVKNKHGDKVLFCDTGVYTKNRNFRLYLSSKLGKSNPLVLSSQNQYGSHTVTEGQKEVFFRSLVAYTHYCKNTKVLTFDQEVKVPGLLGCPRKNRPNLKAGDSIEGYSKSPYPEVDEYITSLITANGDKGAIRLWIYFQQGELIIYEISRYRFCHNIGRQHRSNNIMYVVDLKKGTFYQKCHDPDCHQQNFKSQEWQLPRHVLPESYFDDLEFDDFEDEDIDEEELLNSTLEMEQNYLKEKASKSDWPESDDGSDADLVAAVCNMEGTQDCQGPSTT